MDKLTLTSYVKQIFRDNLKLVDYKVVGATKEYLYKLGLQIYSMAQNEISLMEIYQKLTNKLISQKYNIVLSVCQLKYLKQIITKVKSIPISTTAKGKVYDQSHIVLISM